MSVPFITIPIGVGGKDSDCSRASRPACVSDVQTWSAPGERKCLLRSPGLRHLVGQKAQAVAPGGKVFSQKCTEKSGYHRPYVFKNRVSNV